MINIEGKQIKLQIWDTVSIIIFAARHRVDVHKYLKTLPLVPAYTSLHAGWSRSVQINHPIILQRCCWCSACLRHNQEGHLQSLGLETLSSLWSFMLWFLRPPGWRMPDSTVTATWWLCLSATKGPFLCYSSKRWQHIKCQYTASDWLLCLSCQDSPGDVLFSVILKLAAM